MQHAEECSVVCSARALYDARMDRRWFGGFTVFAGVVLAPIRQAGAGINVFTTFHVFFLYYINVYISAFYIYFFTSLSGTTTAVVYKYVQ